MASNLPYSLRNELLNSGSDDEDSVVSDITTRTRASTEQLTVFPRISARALIKNFGRKGGRLLEGGRLIEGGAY